MNESDAPVKGTPYDPVVERREQELLVALNAIERVLETNELRTQLAKIRIQKLREALADKEIPLPDVVGQTDRPLLPELISDMIAELQDAGFQVRKAEACALRAYGLSMDAIAKLFGVTRQRVWQLTREASPVPAPTTLRLRPAESGDTD